MKVKISILVTSVLFVFGIGSVHACYDCDDWAEYDTHANVEGYADYSEECEGAFAIAYGFLNQYGNLEAELGAECMPTQKEGGADSAAAGFTVKPHLVRHRVWDGEGPAPYSIFSYVFGYAASYSFYGSLLDQGSSVTTIGGADFIGATNSSDAEDHYTGMVTFNIVKNWNQNAIAFISVFGDIKATVDVDGYGGFGEGDIESVVVAGTMDNLDSSENNMDEVWIRVDIGGSVSGSGDGDAQVAYSQIIAVGHVELTPTNCY